MQGNHVRAVQKLVEGWSIPACAGEPERRPGALAPDGVYPRVCRGTKPGGWSAAAGSGLSPRVQGNRRSSTPTVSPGGLSPRVQGNPIARVIRRMGGRSIPACAGEPGRPPSGPAPEPGLSPRVQGNPVPSLERPYGRRSIPACAGEPAHPAPRAKRQKVYPRVCRGTPPGEEEPPPYAGLSPRVQGNRAAPRPRHHRQGSIPACAGEPQTSPGMVQLSLVYPRVCRGTGAPWVSGWRCSGLSPRVQGNPFALIPVRLGGWVYPRVCRGTCQARYDILGADGLSPRVQGNRLRRLPWAMSLRSIPACAGEPVGHPLRPDLAEVYPRVCRGTAPFPPQPL